MHLRCKFIQSQTKDVYVYVYKRSQNAQSTRVKKYDFRIFDVVRTNTIC